MTTGTGANIVFVVRVWLEQVTVGIFVFELAVGLKGCSTMILLDPV